MATTDVVNDVTTAQGAWLGALVSGDADVLDRLTTPDFTYVHSSATLDTRDFFLDAFRSGRRKYTHYSVEGVEARAYPGAVVTSGLAHIRLNPRGEEMKIETRFISVWVQQAGAWKMAAWHSTKIPDA
ncbi:MAG: nuclear transport factor 2 family protein [Dehalococcoidia bacterium]|nr:MAG: nuclear transport factor 2 family protein [Dehalococcoidia bacterium]